MKVGLYLKNINTFTATPGVWGDEIWARALMAGLNQNYPEHKFFIFGENMGITPETDIAIIFHGLKKYGKDKNIFIQQNYSHEPAKAEALIKEYVDLKPSPDIKIATISKVCSEKYGWKLLYPAVNTESFYPVKFDQAAHFEVAYIGNNIKDQKKTDAYLGIAGIKYGVFGHGFNKPVSHNDSLKIFTSSLINLNFVMCPELDILIARPYQISACKGFMVSEWTPTLEKVFGDSMEYIKPGQEPSMRIKEILADLKSNPEKYKAKREAAYKIVKEKFNAETQAKELWEWINVKTSC